MQYKLALASVSNNARWSIVNPTISHLHLLPWLLSFCICCIELRLLANMEFALFKHCQAHQDQNALRWSYEFSVSRWFSSPHLYLHHQLNEDIKYDKTTSHAVISQIRSDHLRQDRLRVRQTALNKSRKITVFMVLRDRKDVWISPAHDETFLSESISLLINVLRELAQFSRQSCPSNQFPSPWKRCKKDGLLI